MRSELAALMYADELLDGKGRLLARGKDLTAPKQSVTLDSVRSVSGMIRFDSYAKSDGCYVPKALLKALGGQ